MLWSEPWVQTLSLVFVVVVVCALIQRFFKNVLERDQYYYLRDITLIGAWALCGLWAGSYPIRLTIAAGVISALIGFCQRVWKRWDIRFAYLLVGLLLSVCGPRISFIGFPRGEFFYLSYVPSILLSSLWVGLFPILFLELDEVPGMAGCLLIITWSLMFVVTLVSSQDLSDAFMMSLMGLSLLAVFWSRHCNMYRRLGEPLAAMWGTLIAGTSILGVSKGVAFTTLMLLPLGLFALPIVETSLNFISLAFSSKPMGNMILYRRLVSKGVDHPKAISLVVLVCGLLGAYVTAVQLGGLSRWGLIVGVLFVFPLVFLISILVKPGKRPRFIRRPKLWGITVDNISLSYALGKVEASLSRQDEPVLIVTPDALAALRSRWDSDYRNILSKATLSLPDGMGLIWALKFLGMPIQERLPGVEFSEQLCRQAAARGWPVFFLGGKPGIAQAAAKRLQEKYPGLCVAGCRDGYFLPEEEEALCEEIRKSGAKILLVGLGVPRQEYWLGRNLPKLGPIVGMGVGGSFDVLSGTLKRAPLSWQRCGCEWLYRAIQEPWRWKRILKLPIFVLTVLAARLHLDPWKEKN